PSWKTPTPTPPTPRAPRLHRQLRRAEKALTEQQTYGEYRPPQRDECIERSYYMPLDDEDVVRADVRVWSNGKQMVDFHLVAEGLTLNGSAWEYKQLARVDICHGHAHAHALIGDKMDDAPTHIGRIDTVADVQTMFRLACAQIIDFARTLRDERGSHD
ncbi:hypothetical protein M4I32_13880, partial [Microbacterium sp. LRZ72]|uniref:hypothetical protein n=1 Tax=Microbacterium sp. LRZ72 TaxID=2942481 RepID=UPI0029B4348F